MLGKNVVLCIGELLIDFICSDIDVDLVEGVNFVKKAGGAPANVAATVAKLGGEASFVGKVGKDPFGVFLEKTLTEVGVDTSMLLFDSHKQTTFAFVSLKKGGERDFVFQRGADGLLNDGEIDKDKIMDARVIHFGSATALLEGDLQDTYYKVLGLAKDNGKFISFDPNYREDLWHNRLEEFVLKSKACIKFADFIKVSSEEMQLITLTEDLNEGVDLLHTLGAKIVAVTLGKEGVFISNGIEKKLIKSIEIDAIDSTGAGDAFVGGFLYQVALLQNPLALKDDFHQIQSIVRFANRVGAITCTRLGAIAALPTLEEVKEVEADYYRLQFHVMPPTGLLNDPNGLININGSYHLFYQWHPADTKHGLKYWGHVQSEDLVNWKQLPTALTPSEWYEKNGCYSGCAVDHEGVLTLIYTGNVKDFRGNRETYQCIAVSEDGVHFKKYEDNPVMYNQPKGYTRHFRDPKVWKKDDCWYMVIGAQTLKEEGRVLLFVSMDLYWWDLVGEVAGSNRGGLGEFGYMWECPDLFTMGDKDILLACPQGLQAKGDAYNNIYQSGYFVGKLDYQTGALAHGEFIELDRGFEFYAPQTMLDHKGRRILIAWMGLPEREEHPTVEDGWIHAMTIPRELQLIGDKIYQKPVEEMKTLRQDAIVYRDITVKDEQIQLQNIYGDVLELYVEIENIDATEYGLLLRTSADEEEKTILCYNRQENKVELNRQFSGKGYGGIRRCAVKENKTMKFHIFMDTSAVEIFINDGEEVFTSRIYPDKKSKGIKCFAVNGSIVIKKIEKWNLRHIEL